MFTIKITLNGFRNMRINYNRYYIKIHRGYFNTVFASLFYFINDSVKMNKYFHFSLKQVNTVLKQNSKIMLSIKKKRYISRAWQHVTLNNDVMSVLRV